LQMLARSRSSVSECFSAFAPHLFVLTHDSANQGQPLGGLHYIGRDGRRASCPGAVTRGGGFQRNGRDALGVEGVAKGLVDRDASGRLTLTGEGRAAVAVLLKADYAPIWARQGRTVRGWERRAPRRCLPPCVRPTVSSVARGPGPPMCPRPQGPGPPLCQGRYPSVRVERERRTGRLSCPSFQWRRCP
jgi:hypothetical protein